MWLECSSDGNPAARYSWIDWTSGHRTAGRVYRADRGSDDAAVGESTELTLQCQASNVIAQRLYVADSSNITLNLTAAAAAAAAPCDFRTYNRAWAKPEISIWELVCNRVKQTGV